MDRGVSIEMNETKIKPQDDSNILFEMDEMDESESSSTNLHSHRL